MKKKITVEHQSCRLCGFDELEEIFNIGNQYINDFVTEEMIGHGQRAPLELVHCQRCDLTQLKHTAPQELLYSRQYWYRSGVTNTMQRELSNIAEDVIAYTDLKKGDIVLDIGANDGTLLKYYNRNDVIRIGCEPANNLISELTQHCEIPIHDFWSFSAYKKACALKGIDQKAKIITAIGMFYDLEDPAKFVSDIANALHDDGVFVAQLMTLAPMLKKNDLGNICHEHIEFYSYKSLVYMYEMCGLEIFKVGENSVNGGSYRIYARKLKNGSILYF